MKNEENDPLSEHMRKFVNPHVPVVKTSQTIGDALSLLKTHNKSLDIVDYIYVVKKTGELVGVFPIKDVFKFPKETKVEKVMKSPVVSVSPKTHLDVVANLSLKHGIKSVPIVHEGKLLGVISAKNILHILNRSLTRDIFHFAGIHHSHLEYENTLTVPYAQSIIHRTPWLIAGLFGIILTAALIGVFQGILEKHIILAFFIPAIAYMSNALGTQVQTLFVRDLAIMGKDLDLKVYLLKHTVISIIIAAIIGVIMFGVISVFWSQPHVAFVIGVAAFVTLILASFTAFVITLLMTRLGQDPALGGGPFATVVSDATSILVYFALASALL